MEKERTFFNFAAEVGLTNHLGGVKATDVLIHHIGEGKYSYFS